MHYWVLANQSKAYKCKKSFWKTTLYIKKIFQKLNLLLQFPYIFVQILHSRRSLWTWKNLFEIRAKNNLIILIDIFKMGRGKESGGNWWRHTLYRINFLFVIVLVNYIVLSQARSCQIWFESGSKKNLNFWQRPFLLCKV